MELRCRCNLRHYDSFMKSSKKNTKSPRTGRIVQVRPDADELRSPIRKQIAPGSFGCWRQAAKQGADIVCTQELFASQYFCQVEDHRFFKLAETIPGPSTDAIGKLAKKYKITVIASLFEKRADRALSQHGGRHRTRRCRSTVCIGRCTIPDDPLYYEKFYFTPGDTGFRAWDTPVGKIGVLICWDQWFPEGARLTAIQGAQILFYPTAIGWHPSRKG